MTTTIETAPMQRSRPTPIAATEHTFRGSDGTELFYRAWMPAQAASRAVLLFHRGHEHSARWAGTIDALALDDTAFFAWDQRGHGRSPGERGGAPSIAAVIKDADCFARHVAATHGIAIEETAVVAHSVGAVIAAAWVHDFAPPIRGLVLAAPAFRVKLYVPLAVPALRLRQRVLGPGHVRSYVKSRVLTHDAAQAAAYDADRAIFRQIAVNVLLDLHDTSTRLVDDAGAIIAPTLVLAAGKDWVVRLDAQQRFYEKLGAATKQFEVFPGMYHAMFHETERGEVVARIREFLVDAFPARPNRQPRALDPALLAADRGGFTRTEYDRLRTPSSLRWRITRRVLSTAGRASDGIDLGCTHGFDSGVMLDYVYRNAAHGRFGVGTLVDRIYLDSPGWRGIRVRRMHLQRLLREAMAATRETGRDVRILDIAAGAGRYVLETLAAEKDSAGPRPTAVLRDYKEANLIEARRLAAALGISLGVAPGTVGVEIAHGDAFDRSSLAAVRPAPTIAIASGIYELVPENAPVLESLRGLADALPADGRLIYTCQPWHPQLEFIARALVNREGRSWAMRRRTQAEMDELVRAAGFEKLDQLVDQWGIFTVSVAARR